MESFRSEQEILELNVKLEAAKNDKTDYEVKLKKAICQIDDLEIKVAHFMSFYLSLNFFIASFGLRNIS